MKDIRNWQDARRELIKLAGSPPASLPDDAKEKLLDAAASPSPVDGVIDAVELLYAHINKTTKTAKEVASGLAAFAVENNFHGMGATGRGRGLINAFEREAGIEHPVPGKSWAPKAEDPEVNERFRPVAPIASPAQPPDPVAPAGPTPAPPATPGPARNG